MTPRILLLLSLAACDAAPSDPAEPGPRPELPEAEDVQLDGTCAMQDRYGQFLIEAYDAYTVVQGQVADGVVPSSILEVIYQEAGCALMLRDNPFCDPGCGSDQACDFDGSCVPFPAAQDLGTVDIAGLAQVVAMEPVMPGFNYFATGLPHPATAPGDTIRVTTSGGTWEPFELWGLGVETLAIPEEVWWVAGGEALELAWTPPVGAVTGEVVFQLGIDQHGTSPLSMECVFEDTGSATVPASIIDALLDAGVSGWPSASLTRRTADRADVGAGCAELIVSSPREGDVRLADFVPCNAQSPCPEPLECNLATEICE